MKFSVLQAYVPTSDDCVFKIVSELLTTVPFTELDMLYSSASDIFIIAPLKCQLIVGTGSPVA